MKRILMTGAAGGAGAFLRQELHGRYHLCLSDRIEITDCGPGESFVEADLEDPVLIRKSLSGVDGIIHLGGYSVAGDSHSILNANIIGAYFNCNLIFDCSIYLQWFHSFIRRDWNK